MTELHNMDWISLITVTKLVTHLIVDVAAHLKTPEQIKYKQMEYAEHNKLSTSSRK